MDGSNPLNRVFLLPWVEEQVLKSESSKELFSKIASSIPEVAKLKMTPQAPRFHAEGARVRSHIERIVSVLQALNTKSDLLFLEEAAREKDFSLELSSLLRNLKTHQDFFLAYAFAHDLGKDKCVSFDVKNNNKGLQEGFRQHGERFGEEATEPEKVRYDKLFRAFEAKHKDLSEREVVAKFYEEYGIDVHYKGHDRVGANTDYTQAREAILTAFNIPLSNAKLFAELIRLHMDILTAFTKGVDGVSYQAFGVIAGKAGLNKELFFDLAAGAIFLDAIVGSLHYEDGKFSHSLEPIINFYRAEREVEPQKHLLREEVVKREEKTALKKIHEAGGLAPEEIFVLLGTPIGPVRGEVMKKVYDLLEDPDADVDFGEHTEEIRRRADKTRELL